MPPISAQSLQQLTLNPNVTIALKVPDFTIKLNAAKYGNSFGRVDGDPFYTSHGYRMTIFVRLNEAPRGFTGYMGVYMRLVQGDHDDSLNWPFDKKLKFIVVDQQNNELQVCNAERLLTPGGETSFGRQFFESNNGRGFQQFILHSTLRTRQYTRNNTVYVAVAIEP